MSAKPFKRGDYILLPYRGKRIDLLCKLIRPVHRHSCHWWVRQYGDKADSYIQPVSTHRCSPSLAKRILGARKL